MLPRCLTSLLATLLTAALAAAQSANVNLAIVQQVDAKKQQIVTKAQQVEFVAVQKTVIVIVNGVEQTRTVVETVPVFKEVLHTVNLRDHAAYTGDGKTLAAADLAKRLEPGAVVAIGTRDLLRHEYRKVLRPEALLLVTLADATPSLQPPPPPKVLPKNVKD